MATGIVKVVGLSFRAVTVELKPNYTVMLVPEPDNKYDPSAVAVKDTNGNLLGYVGKDDPYRAVVLKADAPVEAKVKIANYHAEGDSLLWKTVKAGDLVQLWLEVESDIYETPTTARGVLEKAFVGGEIYYDDVTHAYTNEKGVVYLSGSVYAERFAKPFQAEFIANKMTQGVEGVDAKTLLAMWKLKGDVSRNFGTAIHQAIELAERFRGPSEALDKTYHLHDHPVIKNAVAGFLASHGVETVESEALVVSHKREWAGRIDRLYITGDKRCRVQDFKTNTTIEKDLPKYWEQLRFYGQILTDAGWKVEGLDIFHYNGDWTDYTHEFTEIPNDVTG